MAMENTDAGWAQWAVAGLGAVGALLFGWVQVQISGLSDRVDKAGDKMAEDAKDYATREDVRQLREESREAHSDLRQHLDRRFGELTQSILNNGGKR